MLQITPWERILLRLVADDDSTTDIAARFDMSDRDVEVHLCALFARMGVRNRQEAVIEASRRGLLTRPSIVKETAWYVVSSFRRTVATVRLSADSCDGPTRSGQPSA